MIRRVTAAACGLAALLLSGTANAAPPSPPPFGVWSSQERDVRVRLHDCNGRICGTLVWLKQETDPKTGRPKIDKLNPDPVRRKRPLIGIQVVSNFVPSGRQRWTGTIYNADDGHTYRAHMILRDARTIRLEGCMLVVLCMGHTWHRVGSGAAQNAGAPQPTAEHRFDLRALLSDAR